MTTLMSDRCSIVPVDHPSGEKVRQQMTTATETFAGTRGHVPEGWHTRTQVGELVGRSRSAIKAMEKQTVKDEKTGKTHPLIAPDGEMQCGTVTVLLYSDKAVEHVKEVLKTRKGGRPARKGA